MNSALKKRLLSIKGVGNYAAATLLMLLGHYDELAVDAAFRHPHHLLLRQPVELVDQAVNLLVGGGEE